MDDKTDDHGKSQAAAPYSSIAQMVAALSCDYDRLTELRDERKELANNLADAQKYHAETVERGSAGAQGDAQERIDEAREELDEWDTQNGDELKDLTATAGEYTDADEAREAIQEDPLELSVRSGWHSPGSEDDDSKPCEFRILLCTGGPACRIRGELNDFSEPDRAWLEYQDWGTPWTQYHGAQQDVLLMYCREFYFGE